MKNKVGRG